jgi:cytosine deaminase
MPADHADLVFRSAHLEDSTRVDIAIAGGMIAAIEPHYAGAGAQEIDASGLMASPLFIDAHHHLDCAYLNEQVNHSGTLEEAIAINARIKAGRSREEIRDKACRALEQALLNGTGWLRSHGDVDSVSGLRLMYPVLEAKEKFRGLVDVQFVAFPQLGLVRDPASVEYMRAAMREGADVVGGMPHAEASMEDAARHIDICFEIAQAFDADIDMHIDETDDPASRTLALLAEATIREGYQGRVTAGHCCALSAYDDEYAQRVIDRVAEAQITVVTNPLVNLYLQGRHDRGLVRRGITRVRELLRAGVNVACGLDDVNNIFFPYGRMDMLEVAMITSITAHLTTPEEMRAAFDMPRRRAARALRLEGYDLAVGAPANLTLFEARDAQEALRLQPVRRCVVRAGRIVAQSRLEQSITPGLL